MNCRRQASTSSVTEAPDVDALPLHPSSVLHIDYHPICGDADKVEIRGGRWVGRDAHLPDIVHSTVTALANFLLIR
jgi:hypothetical protein